MRWKILSTLLFSLFLISLNPVQSTASTVLNVSFKKVVESAEIIFEGRVVSKESRISTSTGDPFTYFTFEIIDILKGSYSGKTIELGFMGGPKNGSILLISDMRMPELDESGIYFVESLSRQQVNPLYGWHQGHYLAVKDDQRGTVVIPVEAWLGTIKIFSSKTSSYFERF